jgi:hypothetical protein
MKMGKQNPTERLKEQIIALEIKQIEKGKILKEQFQITYESLKPINLIKNSAKDFFYSEGLSETIIETSVIVVSGLISKKIMNSTKVGTTMKLLTSLLQLGTTRLISKYSEDVQNLVMGFVDRIMQKPKNEPK